MNKKFFTLVALFMAMVVGTVNAQTLYNSGLDITNFDERVTSVYEDYSYQLTTAGGTEYLYMYEGANGLYYLAVGSWATPVDPIGNRIDLMQTLWTVKTQPNDESVISWTFVNKAFGMELTFNSEDALVNGTTVSIPNVPQAVGGDVSPWKWFNGTYGVGLTPGGVENQKTLEHSVSAKDRVVVAVNGLSQVYTVKYNVNEALNGAISVLKLEPRQAAPLYLTADALNTMLGTQEAKEKMSLGFTKDQENGLPNLWTKKYEAMQAIGTNAAFFAAGASTAADQAVVDAIVGAWEDPALFTDAVDDYKTTNPGLDAATVTALDNAATAATNPAAGFADLATAITDATDAKDKATEIDALLLEFTTAFVGFTYGPSPDIEDVDGWNAELANIVPTGTYAILTSAEIDAIQAALAITAPGTTLLADDAAAATYYNVLVAAQAPNPSTADLTTIETELMAAQTALLATVAADAATAATTAIGASTEPAVADYTTNAVLGGTDYTADYSAVDAWATAYTPTSTVITPDYTHAYVDGIGVNKKLPTPDDLDWLSLSAGDDKYLMVDTTLLTNGIGARNLAFGVKKFDVPTLNSTGGAIGADMAADFEGRYNFTFYYFPSQDSVIITAGGFSMIPQTGATKKWVDMTDAEVQESWYYGDATKTRAANLVKLAHLGKDHKEVTLGRYEEVYGDAGVVVDWTMNTRIFIGYSYDSNRTTLPSGLYFFNLVKKDDVQNGYYWVANYAGDKRVYETEESMQLYNKAQDFGHMPRTQWVVKQNPGVAGQQTVTITNREFPHFQYKNVQLLKDKDGNIYASAFNADDVYSATLVMTQKPNSGANVNKYLGYKKISEKDLFEKYYALEYLHGIGLGHYVNVSSSNNDTTVYVDVKGNSAFFQVLEAPGGSYFGADNKYGYADSTVNGAIQLYRTAYVFRIHDSNKLSNDGKYLVYDEGSNSYTVSNLESRFANDSIAKWITSRKLPVFFLKEENQLFPGATESVKDTTCYFALQEAEPLWSWKPGTTAHLDSIVYTQYNPTSPAIINENVWGRNKRVGVRDASLLLTQEPIQNAGTGGEKRIATFTLRDNPVPLYRRLGVTDPEDGFKDMQPAEGAKIYTIMSSERQYLYEDANSKYALKPDGGNIPSDDRGSIKDQINYLGYEGKGDDMLSTLYVDTAYVRFETNMPQYMFAVGVDVQAEGKWCPYDPEHNTTEWRDKNGGPCPHAVPTAGYKTGRYLINAEDSVKWAINKNNTDYVWQSKYTRLAFVPAKHINDTLIIERNGGYDKDVIETRDSIFLGDNLHNINTENGKNTFAKLPADYLNEKGNETIKRIHESHKYGIKNAVFALRLINDEPQADFLIESTGNQKLPTNNTGRWVAIKNGVPVVAAYATYNDAIIDAERFNIEVSELAPTSNEGPAASDFAVVAGNGEVTIKNAAGSKVVISNILGKAIATQTISSDNATIAVPAGIVVVAVDGQAAVKAVVR
ncbi:DUF6383 domain-containing protein [Parabacteroides sp. PF5-9]|uniref:DUF6383 domain-containing protein n=1 Tax=Parabacteroides sp. PF5-9 TaxID=1742404 RepID=UPI00247702B3|nr:DUF6383 domain-containing protein [Parabacteroides sp. PF5-9]MDH6356690.1 hypothetical protein [Parabacteroides sp. PF5-9]